MTVFGEITPHGRSLDQQRKLDHGTPVYSKRAIDLKRPQ
jgi:hypothetical protein